MSTSKHKRFVKIEVERYPAILRDKRKIVLRHYFGQIDLRKTGRVLTQEEKVLLNIDQSRHITTSMIDLMDPSFAGMFDIDEALRLISHNARNKYRLLNNWQQLSANANVTTIEFFSPRDRLTCKSCTSLTDSHLKKKFNFARYLEKTCNCIWFRAEIHAQKSPTMSNGCSGKD